MIRHNVINMEIEDIVKDPEELQKMYDYFKPGGSGPLGAMKIIRDLIKVIADMKGYSLEE